MFLEKHFATQSRARIFQYKSELSTLKNGEKSIAEFVNHAKSLAVSLIVAGCSVDNDDLVLSILNGLSSEFDPIVATITSRVSPVCYDELVGLLLSHEQRLLRNQPKINISAKFCGKGRKN